MSQPHLQFRWTFEKVTMAIKTSILSLQCCRLVHQAIQWKLNHCGLWWLRPLLVLNTVLRLTELPFVYTQLAAQELNAIHSAECVPLIPYSFNSRIRSAYRRKRWIRRSLSWVWSTAGTTRAASWAGAMSWSLNPSTARLSSKASPLCALRTRTSWRRDSQLSRLRGESQSELLTSARLTVHRCKLL